MAIASRSLIHFIDLARRGKHPASSSGEHAARKLAMAVLEAAEKLDDQAVDGLIEFIEYLGTNRQIFIDAIEA